MYEITKHAASRYAERIADRETISDINMYVAQNPQKIVDDINKMMEHSMFIYSGVVGTKNNGNVNVYLSGTWVLLTDLQNSKIITLFKVDFNVGEDFNKQFVQRILERINKHKEEIEAAKKDIEEKKLSYIEIIKSNNEQIAELGAAIKNLKKLNNDYQEVVDMMDSQLVMSNLALRKDVEDLVMKKEF